ncbi:MAG: FHA domain-containing protein [Myxococcaceae bacterium]|nr:FHA domain-containing protein [Myxococcaceae bacterium]MCI0672254.1 FHA domain-containing protein [Myxococcaceae bacterium]
MLSLKELRQLAGTLFAPSFSDQLGPFVLVLREAEKSRQDASLLRTQAVRPADVQLRMLALLFEELDELRIATLPPLRSHDALTVGRLADCDLVLDDTSVSKRHAVLTWDARAQRCSVQDLGSRNGTHLNGSLVSLRPVPLQDGDLLGFGDVAFWYLLTGTLHTRLREEADRRGWRPG